MRRVFSGFEVKSVDQKRQKAGLSIVQATRRVNRHKYVVINVLRIVILGGPVPPPSRDSPRAGTEKLLSRNFSERANYCVRPDVRDVFQFFGIASARSIQQTFPQ